MTLAGLSTAFRRCVGELGMWSASRLFVGTARQHGGDAAVSELMDALGAEFPVLACLVEAGGDATANKTQRAPELDAVAELCAGLKRIVVVGLEADCLNPLLDKLPADVDVGLVVDATFAADVDRLRAGWGQRVELLDLGSFQRLAGTKSALLTTVYGSDGFRAVVTRTWMRCHGDDVRTLFRHLIGWNVMPVPMTHYPRWLVETELSDFTVVVGP